MDGWMDDDDDDDDDVYTPSLLPFSFSCLLESSYAVQAFMKSLFLLEALTCSRREDGLSCRHGVKPPLTLWVHFIWIWTHNYVLHVYRRARIKPNQELNQDRKQPSETGPRARLLTS